MARGRPARHPSARNLELYHELVCEGCSQKEVAERFQVSAPRVTQLRDAVADWVDIQAPPREFGVTDAGRHLHLAIALRRFQLHRAYAAYLERFGGISGAEGYEHLLAASDAGVLPPEAALRLPRRDLIESAVRMARELTELARIARRGPYYELPDRLLEAAANQPEPAASGRTAPAATS